MKKLIKLFTVLTVLLMALVSVYADTTSVTFKGEKEGFELSNDGDLFAQFKGALPGDELQQTITVKNASEDTVKIYLQAVVHDKDNQPQKADATSDESNSFLKELSMTVKNGEELIYEASPDQTAGLTEPVLLGQFAPGDSKNLSVTLTIPATLGNEFANREGEVDWIFTAVKLIDVTVNKVWKDSEDADGIRPDSVTVHLLANGEETAVCQLSEETKWEHVFEDLPSHDVEGNKIEYTVEEDVNRGYSGETKKNDEEGYSWTITNTHQQDTADVDVEVQWDDENDADKVRPDKVTVSLYADGKKVREIEITSEEDWKDLFKDLPLRKDGKKIEYKVDQNKVKGYTTEIKQTGDYSFIIINHHTVGPDTGDRNNMLLWAGLLGGSAAGIIAVLIFLKRNKKSEQE